MVPSGETSIITLCFRGLRTLILLIEMSISQASTGVEAKSKFQTTQFGIDYFPIVSLLFEGENDYIPANKLMGLKNWEYVINIIDHASEPAAQSITVLRKLIEVIESFIQ